jgi:hypothetical protein
MMRASATMTKRDEDGGPHTGAPVAPGREPRPIPDGPPAGGDSRPQLPSPAPPRAAPRNRDLAMCSPFSRAVDFRRRRFDIVRKFRDYKADIVEVGPCATELIRISR